MSEFIWPIVLLVGGPVIVALAMAYYASFGVNEEKAAAPFVLAAVVLGGGAHITGWVWGIVELVRLIKA